LQVRAAAGLPLTHTESSTVTTTACAHPNIALIKYWGKAPDPGNLPAAPSLSITLDTLMTRTSVDFASVDRFELDGRELADPKLAGCLADLRARYDIPPLAIRSTNNFPTAAGLASSASGFAALVTAVDAHCRLGMDDATRSVFARRASGSAARSVFGGFVALAGPAWSATPVLAPDAWPLRVVVAVTASGPKAVASSAGMRRSMDSPYYPAWVTSTHDDFQSALACIAARDFPALADLAEYSCLKMHGLMLASRPGLIYWNAATTSSLHRIRELRAGGLPVFFTVDAGPQVKAICLPEAAPAVAAALAEVPGVIRILEAGLGAGACVESH
jgi:diphosphomevalonate decarboxylase